MNLNQLGEFGLLRRIRGRLPARPKAVRIGIGDDAAVLRSSSARDLIVTTDLLVEGIDFDLHGPSFFQIGRKALAVNLSDIAAMGGEPTAFLIGIAAPGLMAVRAIDEIYRGIRTLAKKHRVALIGGDTSASRDRLLIAVTVLGEVEIGRAVTRSGACVGDRIYVTGTLGDSRAGLEILKKSKNKRAVGRSPIEATLVHRHLSPTPRVAIGRLLGRRRWATAMTDLSDGLASGLRYLCEASGVGARVELERLPLSGALRRYTHHSDRASSEYALPGGEDFELLFTVRKNRVAAVEAAARQTPSAVTPIGEIVSRKRGITVIGRDGRETPLTAQGYDHFSHPS